jgi:NAD(P)-dependent dehydrogenase (short-subunit alcohol dehydrogenase family)
MALLKGKTAVITGGSTGIGLATAKRFVEEGAYVFINGRSQADLDAAVKEIGEAVTGVQGDGSKQGDRDRLYTAVADAAGAWTSCSPTPRPSTSHGSAKLRRSTCERRCRY